MSQLPFTMARRWNMTKKVLITGSLALLGTAIVIWAVWGLAHLPKLNTHPSSIGSRIKPRQLYSESKGALSDEFRDAEMISSDSSDLAIANITTSNPKALEGEYCENHKGCDLAFICVDRKCVKGCTKRNDCAGAQQCKDGNCHFMRDECLNYEKPCTFHEQCCSGYCGTSGTYYYPWPMVCKRFFYPKPQLPGVPGQPEGPKDPKIPTDPKKPEEPKDPKEPEKPKEPKKPKLPKKPKNPKKPKKPKSPMKPKKPTKPKPPKGKDPNHPKKPKLDGVDEVADNENEGSVENSVENSVEEVDETVDEDVTEETENPPAGV